MRKLSESIWSDIEVIDFIIDNTKEPFEPLLIRI